MSTNATFTPGECPICLQEEALFILPDGHSGYCQSCHTEALKNLQKGDLQPECPTCSTSIPIETFQPIVSPELYATIATRMLEWGTPADERLYCSNTNCLKFIPPSAPTASNARECSACYESTCLICKNTAHDGACSEEQDEDRKAAIEAAIAAGGKECPKCGEVVLRGSGCQHIIHTCEHEWCFLCSADWKDCLGSCGGSYEDARRLNEEEPFEIDEEEAEEIAAEEAAAARLSAEFNDWDLLEAAQLFKFLQVIVIVYKEDITRSDPEIAQGLAGAGHILYGYGDEPLEEEFYHNIAWRITEIRDRNLPISTGPDDQPYARNREVLEQFLWPARQSRTDEFMDAEEEATEVLESKYEEDIPEDYRFYEDLLLSLVREDYEF